MPRSCRHWGKRLERVELEWSYESPKLRLLRISTLFLSTPCSIAGGSWFGPRRRIDLSVDEVRSPRVTLILRQKRNGVFGSRSQAQVSSTLFYLPPQRLPVVETSMLTDSISSLTQRPFARHRFPRQGRFGVCSQTPRGCRLSYTSPQPQHHVLRTTTTLLLRAASDQRALTTRLHLTARVASSPRGRERQGRAPPVPPFHPRSPRPPVSCTDLRSTITTGTHRAAIASDRAVWCRRPIRAPESLLQWPVLGLPDAGFGLSPSGPTAVGCLAQQSDVDKHGRISQCFAPLVEYRQVANPECENGHHIGLGVAKLLWI